MKLINKILAMVTLCSSVGLAQAGIIEWNTENNTESFHTYELQAAIRQGLESAGDVPDLPKPWVLSFTLGASAKNDYKAEPGLILIQKVRLTPAGMVEQACILMNYGTYTKTGFLQAIREQAQFAAGYVTTNP